MSQHNEVLPELDYTVPERKSSFKAYLFFKRVFDVFSSGLFLIIFCWLYLILAIAVKCSDGGPVFYKIKRVGLNGRDIYIPHFRTMQKNADELEFMLKPEQIRRYRKEHVLEDDPRLTKFGRFLRKTGLEKLPNVWAVFTGKMSIVGPYPAMRDELKVNYGRAINKLLSVKPGFIGWWNVAGESDSTYENGKRQNLELFYVKNCSLKLDMKIIFKYISSLFKKNKSE